MEKFIGLVSFAFVLAFIAPIISCFLGGFSGWVVGLVFEEQIIGFLTRVGIDMTGMSMFDLGAALGFVGGFLKTTVHQKT
jgi:hypothetical protein